MKQRIQCGRGAPTPRNFADAARTLRGEGTPPTFGGRYKIGILAVVLLVCGFLPAHAADEPRGGRVGWARIITSSKEWNRHSGSDPMLTKFIRQQTSLNIDPTWYSADPARVDELCKYPLLYTNNLTDVTDPAHRKNLTEYLQRGGFILVDACINPGVTPDPDAFLAQHTAFMKIVAPDAEVRRLPNDHDVYRQYFPMKDTPPRQFMNDVFDKRWAKHGLYGVFAGNRLLSIITLSGLQCSWSSHPERPHAKECMKMIVNIYVHAMTR